MELSYLKSKFLTYRISRKLLNIIKKVRYKKSKKFTNKYSFELGFDDIQHKVENNRKWLYNYFHHYYWNYSPDWLKSHREYFSTNNRSFGEDAFHAMWFKLFEKYKPKKVLEIGVYRGSTLSLFSLLSKQIGIKCEIHGISPFNSSGDSVSEYLDTLDYYRDVLDNFQYFHLTSPILHKGYSTDKNMVEVINSTEWDLVFIDGNHDYKIAKTDFENCSKILKPGGIIVLDDAALYTSYQPKPWSSAGHPGSSKVADEIDPNEFNEILAVGHNRVFIKIK